MPCPHGFQGLEGCTSFSKSIAMSMTHHVSQKISPLRALLHFHLTDLLQTQVKMQLWSAQQPQGQHDRHEVLRTSHNTWPCKFLHGHTRTSVPPDPSQTVLDPLKRLASHANRPHFKFAVIDTFRGLKSSDLLPLCPPRY